MKTTFLSTLPIATLAAFSLLAADEPLIPPPLNEVLSRIKPGMTGAEAKAQLATAYPKVKASLGDWSGTTGYVDFRLNERYAVTISAHNPASGAPSEGSAILSKNLPIYVFDHERKHRLQISHYDWNTQVLPQAADAAAMEEHMQRLQHAPYEIVLDGEHIEFDKPESVWLPITVRNLGTKKLFVPDLYWGLSVVWDGTAYKRNPAYMGSWNGLADLYPFPKGFWRSGFSLSEYLVPMDLLTAGRHTIALRDASAESNTQTIFVEKGTAHGAAWGDPVEGVSVRLRAEKKQWATNETPTFKLDVRNQSHREFYTFQSQEPGRLEVDGVWYEWTGAIDLKASAIPPGREYKDIKVTLGLDWKATQEWRDKTQPRPPQISVKLLPGKHTIRFAPEIREIGVEPKPRNTYVPSNAVEIEI